MQRATPPKTKLRQPASAAPEKLITLQFVTAGLVAGAALAVAVATFLLEHGNFRGF